MQPKGTLIENGEYATLVFRRHYPHRIEHVWDAIATPEGLRGWLLCTHAAIEGRAGGQIELISGPSNYHSIGKILVWQPPRVFEYEWNVTSVPEMPRGERAIFQYTLTAGEDDSTHLLVTYRRITRQTASGFLPGLHAFLDRLEAQLDRRALPDFSSRFSDLMAEYPGWRGHAAGPR